MAVSEERLYDLGVWGSRVRAGCLERVSGFRVWIVAFRI